MVGVSFKYVPTYAATNDYSVWSADINWFLFYRRVNYKFWQSKREPVYIVAIFSFESYLNCLLDNL